MKHGGEGKPGGGAAGGAVLVPALIVGAAVALWALVGQLSDGTVRAISFQTAVLLAACWGGRRAGLWATLFGGVAANYFYLGAPEQFNGSAAPLLSTALFGLQGLIVSHLVGALHQARHQAEADAARLRAQEQELQEHRRTLEGSLRRTEESLAVLAHELRNHLSPMVLILSLIERAGATPERLDRLHQVTARQVGQMHRLVEDLLDKSRIARGQVRLERGSVDLGEVARKVVEDQAVRAELAGLRLTVEELPEPVLVDGDAVRLTQIVTNLVQNATKFTDPGGSITVWVQSQPETGTAALGVADTGIGIDPGSIARIFESYIQEETDIERSQKGLGLGLALVRRLVELHGGTVQVKSAGRGKGSEFICLLPLRSAGPPRPGTPRGTGPLRAAREVHV